LCLFRFLPPSLDSRPTRNRTLFSYDHVLHTKFRFRSATFFKTSRLELASEKHKDRVLVTGLRTLPPATSVPSGKGRLVMVVNCHLTGGPVPERRMRQ
ncbi:unnamed protein product, partial [Ectocarpus sp. 12 AP-2014]